jgi:bifunctional UDP-N-acetylglucosamine pyrophosphorylase/glucosamine-1-phosphate N-acetyltransferase
MRSDRPKVLHDVGGLPMIERVLRTASALRPRSTVVVIGHGAGEVRAALGNRPGLQFALQEPQLGTAHAVLQAAPLLAGAGGTLVLLSGDVPLLQGHTLERLIGTHRAAGAAMTVLTAEVDEPTGYGRVIRQAGEIQRIVEERDATAAERRVREINSGIYAFAPRVLYDALGAVTAHNDQQEYYLPDLVGICRRRGFPVATVSVADPSEIRGINSRAELAEVGRIVRQQKNVELMAAGVTLIDPATTYVDPDVTVGRDTTLRPGVHLEGRTTIGAGCVIHSGVRILDSSVGDRVTIRNHSVIEGSTIDADADVGPFAHLRPESHLGARAKVGNFVELKKTVLGAGSKANHLAYLGDATIGDRVNVGAGTITCNYDGTAKHPTTIDDEVFIGSDTQLVAPVRVGKGAYIAAGSSITEDVPAGALAIARSRQVNKPDWADKKKAERMAGAHGHATQE